LPDADYPRFTRGMKTSVWLGLVAAGCLALSNLVFGQAMTVTGKVLTVTSNMITVQTDSGVWEVTRGSNVKVTGELVPEPTSAALLGLGLAALAGRRKR